MASWKANLRPASFRGKKFFVDSSQYTGGRRVTFHEFPNRDKPFPEDLGKVGETFKIDGYILGDNYFDLKKDIKEAANTEGPGELVHPYFGTMQVQCGAFSIDEVRGEGRYAKISFQFYEAGDNRFPQQVDDKQSVLEDSAANALGKSKGAFDKKFSILGAPGFVVDSARGQLSGAMDAIQKATVGVRTTTNTVSNLAFSIRNAKAQLTDLMKFPGKLSKNLQDSFALLQEAINKPVDLYRANSTMFAYTASTLAPFMTPARKQESKNNDAITQFMRQNAVVNATLAASVVPFDSVSAASAVRDQLHDEMESISLATDDDDVYQAFQDLRANLVKTIPDLDAQLPNIQSVFLENTSNSLVVSYDLFENPDSEADLILRNKIKNPAFIVGGTTLEVIDVRKSS